MIINHNMQAINAHRQMGSNQVNAQKSMEKLSSGLRINRAGDDAAGLAISEKMRGQIRGLDQAGRNAQDGISLIQTAEGALNETHSILQRMRELSVQSANDTNTDADRAELQKEINQLTQEIDRIADTTEFNTQTLLKGDNKQTLASTGVTVGATVAGEDIKHVSAEVKLTVGAIANGNKAVVELNGQKLEITFKEDTGSKDGKISATGAGTATVDITKTADGSTQDAVAKGTAEALQKLIDQNDQLKGQYEVSYSGKDITIKAVAGGDFEGSKGNIKTTGTTGGTITVEGAKATGTTTSATAAKGDITFTGKTGADLIGKGITIGGNQIEFYDASKGVYKGDAIGISIGATTNAENVVKAIVAQAGDKLQGVAISEKATGILEVKSNQVGKASTLDMEDGGKSKEYKINLQVGANAGQTMSIEVGNMGAKALGVNTIDVSSAKGAEASTKSIDAAITKVSAQRSQLGAFQNRLEHTINNLGTSSENLTAAESRIRDVDMAKEMMAMSKNNILQQASQAMLAQANQAPQQVLQLLR